MGFLDTLRGGGNKDGMRQTTSLTMAYLLDQNARFEAFMRQKVEELETIVTQQQARASAVGEEPPDESDEPWPEPAAEEAGGELEQGSSEPDFGDMTPQEETRPVVGQFVLDEGMGGEEGLPVEQSPAAEPGPAAGPAMEPDEPAESPPWQAILLGPPAEEKEGTDPPVEAAPVETEEQIGEPDEALQAGETEKPVKEPSDGSDFAPDWLRRQQAGSKNPGEESAQKVKPAADPAGLDDKIEAASQEQAALPAEVAGDDEAWDTSLEGAGPAGEWA